MTQDGHLEFVQIQFVSPVDSDTIAEQLNRYVIAPVVATLPSTPQSLFLVQKAMPSPRQIGYLPSGMEIIIGDITNQQLRLDQKPKDDRTLAWPYVPINGEANDLEKEIRKQGFEGPINIRRE